MHLDRNPLTDGGDLFKCYLCDGAALAAMDEFGDSYCARCLGREEGREEAERERALDDLRRATIVAFGYTSPEDARSSFERAFVDALKRKEHLASIGYAYVRHLLSEDD
jgi:hypothetical protein